MTKDESFNKEIRFIFSLFQNTYDGIKLEEISALWRGMMGKHIKSVFSNFILLHGTFEPIVKLSRHT